MADITLDPHVRPELVQGNPSLGKITDDVAGIVRHAGRECRSRQRLGIECVARHQRARPDHAYGLEPVPARNEVAHVGEL